MSMTIYHNLLGVLIWMTSLLHFNLTLPVNITIDTLHVKLMDEVRKSHDSFWNQKGELVESRCIKIYFSRTSLVFLLIKIKIFISLVLDKLLLVLSERKEQMQ